MTEPDFAASVSAEARHHMTISRPCARLVLIVLMCHPVVALGQITARVRGAQAPPWNKGILPISPESYYNAIECGEQGGADPPCVFWDTGLCQNPDFTLTVYTPYKSVAYEVWRVVSQKHPPPKPSYGEAQRTRVTIAVASARGSTNALTNMTLTHGGHAMAPIDRSISAEGGRFTFDFPAFAPTADVMLELVGRSRTLSCRIPRSVLTTFR